MLIGLSATVPNLGRAEDRSACCQDRYIECRDPPLTGPVGRGTSAPYNRSSNPSAALLNPSPYLMLFGRVSSLLRRR
jgi:hypothetical protein